MTDILHTYGHTEELGILGGEINKQMAFKISLLDGMNRGRVVTAALGDFQILQGFPLGRNRIEEGRAVGGGCSPEENSDALRYQRGGNEQDEEAKKLLEGVKLGDERCQKFVFRGKLQGFMVVILSLYWFSYYYS